MLKQYEFGFKRFLGNPVMVGSSRAFAYTKSMAFATTWYRALPQRKTFWPSGGLTGRPLCSTGPDVCVCCARSRVSRSPAALSARSEHFA